MRFSTKLKKTQENDYTHDREKKLIGSVYEKHGNNIFRVLSLFQKKKKEIFQIRYWKRYIHEELPYHELITRIDMNSFYFLKNSFFVLFSYIR